MCHSENNEMNKMSRKKNQTIPQSLQLVALKSPHCEKYLTSESDADCWESRADERQLAAAESRFRDSSSVV